MKTLKSAAVVAALAGLMIWIALQLSNMTDPKLAAWATSIQAVCAFVVMVFTGLLVHYNRDLLTATREAADAAIVSANAARDAADIAKTTLYLTQRARVGFTHVRLDNLETQQPIVGRFRIRNWYGKPAADVRYCSVFSCSTSLLPETPTYPDRSQWRELMGPLIVGDGAAVLEVPFGRVLSAGEWAAVMSGQVKVHFYGCAEYSDGLGNTKRVGFCREFEPGKNILKVPSAPNYTFAD